ncbi:hypothetical protein O6H91_18G040100 [Diphasiastrum complanatum]|uniref:Uncharacterized protein n=1 Tax=Diphasiastrum complanatum TaxID=34168 RepID=A0ACC2B0E3_DIPCM|nr:hypothetical protein O6H91_18G040100 [Diphasiastrum complanatum]
MSASMLVIFFTIACAMTELGHSQSDYLVSLGEDGKLVYKVMPNLDRIMDFSAVGYGGKDLPLPDVPVNITLTPLGEGLDDTEQIQAAIDKVSELPLDPNGLRGAVKLLPGIFNVGNATINITATGVSLKGSGTATILNAHGLSANLLFLIGQAGEVTGNGNASKITNTVPSGTNELIVEDVGQFNVGDLVLVTWPWTMGWIKMMNMTQYWTTNQAYSFSTVERTVIATSRSSNQLTLDIPLPFRIDQQYLGDADKDGMVATVMKIQLPVPGRISNVGIQDLRAVKDATTNFNVSGSFAGLLNVEDGWISNVGVQDFGGSLINLELGVQASIWINNSKQVTLQQLNLTRTIPAPSAGHTPKPFDIDLHRPVQQVLVKECFVLGDNEYSLIPDDGISGPNVFFNCTLLGNNHVQPHAHFATGLLYDNINVPDGSIDLLNRGAAGTGQGFAIGYGIVYHSNSSVLNIEAPLGAFNLAIGCNASIVNPTLPNTTGLITSMDPRIPSLFVAQRHQAGLR